MTVKFFTVPAVKRRHYRLSTCGQPTHIALGVNVKQLLFGRDVVTLVITRNRATVTNKVLYRTYDTLVA